MMMNFSTGQKSPTPSTSRKTQKINRQELKKQTFSELLIFEEALIIVDHLVFTQRHRHLSTAEIIVLKGAWFDKEYEEIAENSRFSLNYLQRSIAPRLWDMLSEIMGSETPVGKKRLRSFLEEIATNYHTKLTSNTKQTSLNMLVIQGDKPPDVSSFFGRQEDLAYLKNSALKQQCITLTGVAGIGKSALAVKLLAEISIEAQPRFSHLIWKSLARGPLIQDLVSDLIELIQPQEPLPEYTQEKISLLLKQMHIHRCLIVLDADDADNALFRQQSLEQRREYEIFFRRLVEERHQSCLLLTSRALPRELEDLIATKRSIQEIKIGGLDLDAAMELLSTHGLTNFEKCSELIETYRGSPSELEVAANRIYRFFGSTENFLANKTTFISPQLQTMLNQMFGQVLSSHLQQIVIYLAKEIDSNSKFIGFHQILSHLNQNHPITESTTSALVTALEELEKQSLIEVNRHSTTKEISFTLRPAIKKYILTDPLGLVRARSTSSHQNVGDRPDYACNSRTQVQPIH